MTKESASEAAYKEQIASLQREKEVLELNIDQLRRDKFALAEKLHQHEVMLNTNQSGWFLWNILSGEFSLQFPGQRILGEKNPLYTSYPKLLQHLDQASRFTVRRLVWKFSQGLIDRQQLTVYLQSAKDSTFPLLISASLQRSENGEPVNVLGLMSLLQMAPLLAPLETDRLNVPVFRVEQHSGDLFYSNRAAQQLWQTHVGGQEMQYIDELIGSERWQFLQEEVSISPHTVEVEISLNEGQEYLLFGQATHQIVNLIFVDISPLKQTIKELQQVNVQLDNFVYHASHDLRAPLRTVLGLMEVLRVETRREERERCVDLIEGSIQRLESLVVDLLSISRNKRVANPLVKINFMVEVNLAVSNFYHLGNTRNLEIRTKISQPVVFVADLTRVRIVLNNIVSNAIKYRRYGPEPSLVDIRIWVDEQAAHLEVEDNGEGIAEEKLPLIFDMFYRASDRSEGSGLGLYIVRDVLQKLEGSIEVYSTKNVGSLFRINIPNRLRLL